MTVIKKKDRELLYLHVYIERKILIVLYFNLIDNKSLLGGLMKKRI
jgi:hypothetical protein